MTPDEKIKEIKELEQNFIVDLEAMRKEYSDKIKAIISDVEQKKIDALKKDLGI